MPGVFISYRRLDSAGHAGRLCDRLQARLGRDRVFMDVTSLTPGVDFVQALERVLGSCDVLLAIIGPEWLTCADANGRRRLDDPEDFVRLELGAALERDVRVIPVLVGGASVPPIGALPDELKPLSHRQTVELRDTRWDADTGDLIDTITNLAPSGTGATSRTRRFVWLLAGAAVATAAVAGPVGRYFRHVDASPSPPAAITAATQERLLTYSVTARPNPKQHPGSAPIQVAEDRIFVTGELIRFSFSSPQVGFLYLINESPPDKRGGTALNVLFPSPTSNDGSARLAPAQDVRIPEIGDGFELDATAGTEKLWVVWSAARIEELDALKRWANPRDQGEIKDARDIQMVREFLIRHVSPAPEVHEDAGSTRVTLKSSSDPFVKLIALEHR